MKNLTLTAKVGILVAVFLATILIVAIVGVVQLTRLDARFDRMANTTSKAVWHSGDGRIELLTAIRGEKNAILIPDKTQAAEFADQARKAVGRLKEIRGDLEVLVGVNVATPEGKATSELGRAIEEFEKVDTDLLRQAVIKSDVEGARILYDELYPQCRDLEEFVNGLAGRTPDKAAPTSSTAAAATSAANENPQLTAARVAAGQRAVGSFRALLSRLSLQLHLSNPQEMAQMEVEIRQGIAATQDDLRRLAATLSDSERPAAGPALTSIDAIKSQATEVVQLSRTHSDHLAREISITQGVGVGNRCSMLFDEVRKALKSRVADDSRDVTAAALLGRNILVGTGVAGALASFAVALLVIRSITRPVDRGVKVFEAMAGGDLTRRMNLDRRDEIGRLGAASDQMSRALCEVVTQIRAVGRRLGDSAGELAKVSTDLLSQSHEMTAQAESVAAGTEQMSTNVSTMAAAAEEMSVNVSSISSASEEVSVNVGSIVQSAGATSRSVGSVAESIARITSSLQDVARDARHGSQITQQAKDMAAAATRTMRQLDQAASEITKVTEVIKSIALQTNLLALNATIEATSAGEAGKGFAVVASEVKELASQSAQSAEDIARKIEGVQASTREAVKVIENVAQFVDQVNVSAGRISDAVDGQTQSAGQIECAVSDARQGVESIARSIAEVGKGATDVSRNTSEAATAATDVSRNAAEAAKAAETISSNIHGVSDATRLSTASAAKLNDAARQLDELATELQRIVSRFHVGDHEAVPSQHSRS
ncbi:MAG TPA: methyl-accepting chemotaxis protein [Tepidisphaeraceae bacterium]